MQASQWARHGLALSVVIAANANGQTTFSEGPGTHRTLATASVVPAMLPGDSITGSLGNVDDRDVWRLFFPATTPGIYRVRLNNPNSSITPVLLGASQTNGVINPFNESSSLQGGLGHRAYNQFYTFGHATSAYFRLGTNSTQSYNLTLTRESVTPIAGPMIDIGTSGSGPVTLTTVGLTTTDTDLWVYDANFNPIPGYGNDDASATIRQSRLTRTFSPGTYYLAVSGYNLAPATPSPADDGFRSGFVTSSPGILARGNQSTTVSTTSPFSVSIGGQTVTTQFGVPFDVSFIRFTVIPTPAGAVTSVISLLWLARRTRAS